MESLVRFIFFVLVILASGNLAEANYDYSTGRWLQRDPIGYADGMNLYEYVKSNPCIGLDPRGNIYEPILPPTKDELCQIMYNAAVTKLSLEGAPLFWECGRHGWLTPVYPESWPFTHCVWSCRMARDKGRDFAWSCGLKKEKYDEKWADARDRLIANGCYDSLSKSQKKYLEGSACSASQPSDYRDNGTGIECGEELIRRGKCWGLREPKKPGVHDYGCEACCEIKGGITKKTPEGKDTPRPYGPRCKFPELLE